MATGGQVGTSKKPQCIWPPKGEPADSCMEAATSEGSNVTVSDQHNLLRMMNSSLLPLSKSHTILLLANSHSESYRILENAGALLGRTNRT